MSNANRHRVGRSLRHQHERRQQFGIGLQHSLDRGYGEVGIDVAGTKVNQADQWLVLMDGQGSEVGVVSDENSPLRRGEPKQVDVL